MYPQPDHRKSREILSNLTAFPLQSGKTAFMTANQAKRYKTLTILNNAREAFDLMKVTIWHNADDTPERCTAKVCEILENDGYDGALKHLDGVDSQGHRGKKTKRMIDKYKKHCVLGALLRIHGGYKATSSKAGKLLLDEESPVHTAVASVPALAK